MFNKRLFALVLAVTLLRIPAAFSAEPIQLEDEPFQDQLRGMDAQSNEGERLRRAKTMVLHQRLSSLQVKAIAIRLGNDEARLEFALAAYPMTVDPENFYEVYDAFRSFSKVLRLHDQIRPGPHRRPGPVVVAPEIMTDADLKGILEALRKESFDQTRSQMARQILSSSRRLFLARQVKQMLECFDFEQSKLELAKFAYDYTYDREKYFLLNDAFSFSGSKDTLSRYVESKLRESPPGR